MSVLNIEFDKVVNVRGRQRGLFTIEFSIIIASLAGIFWLAFSHMIAVNIKGQLDRAAYSLASITAERKQLFGGDIQFKTGSAKDMKNIVSSSMKRMSPSFNPEKLTMRVEVYYLEYKSDKKTFELEHKVISTTDQSSLPREPKLTKEQAETLLPFTNRGRYLPLYRVTLGYQVPFDLIGVVNGQINQVVSSAYTFGRL